jgi:hypothetical protein
MNNKRDIINLILERKPSKRQVLQEIQQLFFDKA